MTVWKNLWNKINPNKDHGGVIEWDNPLDVPPEATAPIPFDSIEEERLVGEWIELDSRPAPLGGKP